MPTTTIRYDERTRAEVAPLLESMGLSINSYLNLALRQLVIQRRVPFSLYASTDCTGPTIVPGASPKAKKVDGRLVLPADWNDDDDEGGGRTVPNPSPSFRI